MAWKQKQVQNQRDQLEEVLRGHVPRRIATTAQYAAMRERLAVLRAFQRKLGALAAENDGKCRAATTQLLGLEERFPAYKAEYEDKYRAALRESGIQASNVALMRYVGEELSDHV